MMISLLFAGEMREDDYSSVNEQKLLEERNLSYKGECIWTVLCTLLQTTLKELHSLAVLKVLGYGGGWGVGEGCCSITSLDSFQCSTG